MPTGKGMGYRLLASERNREIEKKAVTINRKMRIRRKK
jgi:hypothetical protein